MANEAIKRYAPRACGDTIVDFTVADALSFEKGTFVELIDPRAVSGVSASGVVCAGIIAREKIANDGRTQVAVYREGDFDVVASGAIAIGQGIRLLNTANKVAAATSADSGAALIGYALETASDAEVFQMRLRL